MLMQRLHVLAAPARCTVVDTDTVQKAAIMSEVGITELRQGLKDWIARAQQGDEVIVTDRGRPVARLTGITTPSALDRLVAEGRITPPRGPRPRATAQQRVRSAGSVSSYVAEARDPRRA